MEYLLRVQINPLSWNRRDIFMMTGHFISWIDCSWNIDILNSI
jgi:hypothetical protein